MMKRVPRLRSGTFSQPAAKTLTSFCLHFGQTSSRLQSQWDLGGQRRRFLHVACKNSKRADGGGGLECRAEEGERGCAEGPQCSTGDVCRRRLYAWIPLEVSRFHPGPGEM